MLFLPYGKQNISPQDIDSVVKVLESDLLTTGPAVNIFESNFKACVNSQYAAACSSGTAALHLAAMALNLKPNDHVIVPAITFTATANAIKYTGADVIFSDVDPHTGLMLPEHLEQVLAENKEKNIKALFPVHLNGQCVDLPKIKKIAEHHNLHIVEDACHALGTHYEYNNTDYTIGSCSHSDMTIFSFHPVKTVACGEGGMVTSNNEKLIQNIYKMRNHGITRDEHDFLNKEKAFEQTHMNPWYYEMQSLGYNYRLSDIHCALGTSQLKKLDQFKEKRQKLYSIYQENLSHLPYLKLIEKLPTNTPCWHLLVVLINFEEIGMSRRNLMDQLKKKNIGSQVHYLPVYQHPYYQNLYGKMKLSGAETYYHRCLSLPLYPSMEESDVEYITDTITKVLRENSKKHH